MSELERKVSEAIGYLSAYDEDILIKARLTLQRIRELLSLSLNGHITEFSDYLQFLNEHFWALEAASPPAARLVDDLNEWFETQFRALSNVIENQEVILSPLDVEGFILDLGGGGEGIIGKLHGRQVVAIDLYIDELAEKKNDSLKLVMDATDLKFVSESFDAVTAFFTFMYIPELQHAEVFKQVHRVLKIGGMFHIWDVVLDQTTSSYPFLQVQLEITLPNEVIKAEYGNRYSDKPVIMDAEYFCELGLIHDFELLTYDNSDQTYHVLLRKK
jgi:hypothetical protein